MSTAFQLLERYATHPVVQRRSAQCGPDAEAAGRRALEALRRESGGAPARVVMAESCIMTWAIIALRHQTCAPTCTERADAREVLDLACAAYAAARKELQQ